MYTPAAFLESDLALLDVLAPEYPFATLITSTSQGPFVSHLPILYRREGQQVALRGHWSRANPQWRHEGDAVLILHGPQSYISPAWYPDKESAARVPTWNYVVAHLTGPLRLIDDESGLAGIVSDLTLQHETAVGSDWRFDLGRDELRSQLRGIVGFEMLPRRIELKYKLNQNHPEANVRGAAEKLSQGGEQSRAVAKLMLERLAASHTGEMS